jgi:hypothetical protein
MHISPQRIRHGLLRGRHANIDAPQIACGATAAAGASSQIRGI